MSLDELKEKFKLFMEGVLKDNSPQNLIRLVNELNLSQQDITSFENVCKIYFWQKENR